MNVRESYSCALEQGTLTSVIPLVVLAFGLLLTGLGLLAFFAFAVGEDRSVTALIPAFWGLPIVVCAVATLVADRITGRGYIQR